MTFLSPAFALFVALGFVLFHAAPERWRPHVLLALSYLYYVTWSVGHALLLLGITVVVYFAARVIERDPDEHGKFRTLTAALGGLGILLVGYKCAAPIAEAWGQGASLALLVAPLGLSYYLFKLMGYLLDVYWEQIPSQRSLVSLALYASFYPQIVSGPIQRAEDFFAQLPALGRSDPAAAAEGLRRILFGLFKKLVLAERLAVLANVAHANPAGLSSLELWIGAYGFALQLYVDFSGITDIAIGIGLLFGIRGPENFRLPFFARDLPEFWRRWHMSLTSWLTDYLFVPLRMSLRRLGDRGLAIAIFTNMLAVGLWHGPKWTNAAFGAINGVFLVIAALTQKRRNLFFKTHPALAGWRAVTGPLLTFHMIVLALVVFRASSLGSAVEFLRRLVPGLHAGNPPAWRLEWARLGMDGTMVLAIAVGVAVMEGVHWVREQPAWQERFFMAPRALRWGVYYAAIVLIGAFGTFGGPEFIYAQF